MKLLLVALQKRAGGALDALGFSDGLCANRFAHTALISEGNEQSAGFALNEYRTTVRIPTYGGSMKDFLLRSLLLVRPWRVVREIRRARPDIVHIMHFHPWDIMVFLARSFYGYKIIYGVQEDPYARKDTANPWVMGPLGQIFAARADIVAPYSEFMKRELARHIPESKIMPIYAGDYRRFCPAFAHKGFHVDGPLRLLFFGPIKNYKGVDVLVKAFAACRERGLDVALTIAGTQSPEVHILDKKAIKKLEITWIDRFLSQEEIGALMEGADVMAIPYRNATQATPAILAFTYALPSIATKSGALPEQVKDGVSGLLVEPDNVESFAQAIEVIYKDRGLLKKFSEGAKKLGETKFSQSEIARCAIHDIYRKLEAASPIRS